MKKTILFGALLSICLSALAADEADQLNNPTKRLYDFVVPRDGSIAEAIAAANSRPDTTSRYRIFILSGDYVIPADSSRMVKGGNGQMYPSPITVLRTPYVSIIGEDYQTTGFTNTVPPATWNNGFNEASPLEGISKSDVLNLGRYVHHTYMQGISIRTSMGDRHGRDIALNDNGDKTILKECCLWGYQDTYVSHQRNRYYFEGGVIRGNTDYCCGKGDVWYNQVTLRTKGGYLAVPSKPRKYGYIFDRCRIVSDGENGDGSYTLGRPWGQGTPIALFLNTVMEIIPKPIGWDEMGKAGYPSRFAEYNSRDAKGNPVDLSGRKTSFGGHDDCNVPSLTREEAERYTIALVMGAEDGWDPTLYTAQVSPVESFRVKRGKLSWRHNPQALLYAIVRNGHVVDFTTDANYRLPADAHPSDKWSVRCANWMGGLGEATDAVSIAK
ncbi:MAG: hypothetical protein K6E86_09860 [Bacteroidales bacterium]|nr:hypothetical protein [Bacteroidales bacterium]